MQNATALPRSQKWLVPAAFVAIYFVWGTTYLAIVFALEGFPPFLLSALRFCTAGLLLLLYSRGIRRQPLPRGKRLWIAVSSGIIMLVGGSGLVTWAEQYVASGHAAMVVATEPFMFVLLDRKRWSFYFSRKKIVAGLLVGFGGVALFLFGAPAPEKIAVTPALQLAGYAVLFGSCLLWVIGSLFSRSAAAEKENTLSITAVQLLAAGLFSGLLSGVTGEWPGFSLAAVSPAAWGGLLYLIFMGSIVAYLAFNWLLTVRPPAQVSTHTYVNPVVALLLGWWILQEPMAWLQVPGMVLILLGVYLATIKKDKVES